VLQRHHQAVLGAQRDGLPCISINASKPTHLGSKPASNTAAAAAAAQQSRHRKRPASAGLVPKQKHSIVGSLHITAHMHAQGKRHTTIPIATCGVVWPAQKKQRSAFPTHLRAKCPSSMASTALSSTRASAWPTQLRLPSLKGRKPRRLTEGSCRVGWRGAGCVRSCWKRAWQWRHNKFHRR
jgi:hypothetical protein